ncbi:hypothetical protein BD769DRAFT_1525464 [Suillus cothurnatus]|nr:hypothetical protein BD769DRAFT_1525464 [Suillus cothurnatus]
MFATAPARLHFALLGIYSGMIIVASRTLRPPVRTRIRTLTYHSACVLEEPNSVRLLSHFKERLCAFQKMIRARSLTHLDYYHSLNYFCRIDIAAYLVIEQPGC